MQYPSHFYAKALAEAVANPNVESDAVVRRFLALIRKNGAEGQTKKILNEAARLVRRKGSAKDAKVREVIIASARPLTEAQRKMVDAFLTPYDIVREKINPDLVAGVKIVVDDELQFDGTMKAKLDALFGN